MGDLATVQVQKTLPICLYEEEIVDAVDRNSVVIVIGATGSGKTTQLAQFLHKAGFTDKGVVGVTQPRRVAAVSVARRVAQEMGVPLAGLVGYSVRFEDRTSPATRIKYLTDGCLLREFLHDVQLQHYSVVILDEAHERSLQTDILIGLLRRLVATRQPPLKLLVTSATLDGQKFSAFFGDCPVLDVPGKLHPVEILHATERPASHLESAVQTAMDIHRRRPEGDILVFLTGQDEIDKAVRKTEEAIGSLEEGACMDAVLLPLHASLPPELQARVFAPVAAGCRRIIYATNVAETSLTLDGIVYVVDPGFVKQRQYNPATGMDALSVVPISRVQAVQRAGRAGRTRAGVCFRLYPRSCYEHEMPAATVPEIQRASLAGAVLHLKSLRLPGLDVLSFAFLDRPASAALQDALRQLYVLDAIDADGRVTPLGLRMAELPLEPALARMLLAAQDLHCTGAALTVAAMLSCDSSLFEAGRGKGPPGSGQSTRGAPSGGEHGGRDRGGDGGLPDGSGLGDHVMLLQVYEAWERTGFDLRWCQQHGLKARSLQFARDVRRQLAAALKHKGERTEEESGGRSSSKRKRRESEVDGMRRALCVGFATRLARRMARHNGYRTLNENSKLVEVHPGCAELKVDDEGLLPEWVLYHELVLTSRPFMRQVCAVRGEWAEPFLERLHDVDVARLSGRQPGEADEETAGSEANLDDHGSSLKADESRETQTSAVDAARARYLARKKTKK
eukprot:jgi/Mesen1/7745/ME000407S06973